MLQKLLQKEWFKKIPEEATGDLTRNKIADKITSIGKPKEKKKQKKQKTNRRSLYPTRKKTANY